MSFEEDFSIGTLIDELIDREGGFVDHPADRGGPTHWGITEAVARAHGFTGEMRNLPRMEAARIYREKYWTRPGFGQVAAIAPRLAAEMFDTGVNMGPGRAISHLQRALNALNREEKDYADIAIDQHIGPRTIDALNRYFAKRGKAGEMVLLKAVEALQGAHYLHLAEARPSQEAFLYGWLANRIGQA